MLSAGHRCVGAQRMYRISILLLPLFAVLVAAAGPDGRVIAHDGNGHGATACIACHGQNLQGNPALGAPALAGLPTATVLARLAHYASPDGHNAMMRQVATALSPAERQVVAAYLASLPRPQDSVSHASP
jgi:cytochrome c553